MISAFGVDHGEISKSLKPRHLEALGRAAQGGQPKDKTHMTIYARARLKMHGVQDMPDRAVKPVSAASGRVKLKGTPAFKETQRRSMRNALSQASPYRSYGKTRKPLGRVLP